MKKLFLQDGKLMVGEFPEYPESDIPEYRHEEELSHFHAQNQYQIRLIDYDRAVSAAKASAVEVVNPEVTGFTLLAEYKTFIVFGNEHNEPELIVLPQGWTVEIENACRYEETDGNCPDCFKGNLCKKIARLISVPVKSSGIVAAGLPEYGQLTEEELIDKMCNDAAETIKQLQEENQRLKSSMKTLLMAWQRGDSYEFYEDLIEKHKLIEP